MKTKHSKPALVNHKSKANMDQNVLTLMEVFMTLRKWSVTSRWKWVSRPKGKIVSSSSVSRVKSKWTAYSAFLVSLNTLSALHYKSAIIHLHRRGNDYLAGCHLHITGNYTCNYSCTERAVQSSLSYSRALWHVDCRGWGSSHRPSDHSMTQVPKSVSSSSTLMNKKCFKTD